MTRQWLLWLASAQLVGCASMNMKKECYANGVCRIDQNGQVSWSGPPEEVAKMQGAQEGRAQALAEVDKAYAEAPRRSESEPIRLVLIGPTADAPDLASLSSVYRPMMEASLRGDPRIELVPYDRVKLLAEASSGNSMRSSSFHQQEVRAKVDSELTHRLRDGNSDVDVVLVAHMVPKGGRSLGASGHIIAALGFSSPARRWLTCEALESAIECKFRVITDLGCNRGKASIGIA